LADSIVQTSSNRIYSSSEATATYKKKSRLLKTNKFSLDMANSALLEKASAKMKNHNMVYIPLDGSNIRKPHMRESEGLMRVKDLGGGFVNGYKSVNAVCVSPDFKDVSFLECVPFSSYEEDFKSEFAIEAAIISESTSVMREVDKDKQVVFLLDRGFDDQKVLVAVRDAKANCIIRVSHTKRGVMYEGKLIKIQDLPFTKSKVSFTKTYSKLKIKNRIYQDVTTHVEALEVNIPLSIDQPYSDLKVTIVKSTLKHRSGLNVFDSPLYLMTTMPVAEGQAAYRILKDYMSRWIIESVFKFMKETLGWEDFQIRDLESIKKLITMTWLVGAYLYEVEGIKVNSQFIELIAGLGNGKGLIGKKYISQGLAQLSKYCETQEWLKTLNRHQLLELCRGSDNGSELRSIFKKGGLL
jgi:hypothetical protein